jgi:hypothetical protein
VGQAKSDRQEATKDQLACLMTSALIDIRATAYSGAHLVEIEGFTDLERIRLWTNVLGQCGRLGGG